VSTAIAAVVVLYRLISFVFIIGIGWITWLIIRHRHRDHMTART
jgi:putative heme transporter